jgi:uncharacterized protein YcnI
MSRSLSIAAVLATVTIALPAAAHVSVQSGNGIANQSGLVTFGVGHGCTGADTYAVTIDIPAGVTSVRPMFSDFGNTSVTLDANNVVTSVTWQKPLTNETALAADTNYYQLLLRLKPPNTPFTTLYFPAHQTCRAANGTLSTVEWTALPGQMGEPAPALNLVPAHLPGWNKVTMPFHVGDELLPIFFGDALIVWRGTDAFSVNPNTVTLIESTPGVNPISGGVHPDDEVWIRY